MIVNSVAKLFLFHLIDCCLSVYDVTGNLRLQNLLPERLYGLKWAGGGRNGVWGGVKSSSAPIRFMFSRYSIKKLIK